MRLQANNSGGGFKDNMKRNWRDDPDLKCPKHDEMSFVLAKKTNCINVIRSSDWCSSEIHIRTEIVIKGINLEHPIASKTGFIHGYCDALIVAGFDISKLYLGMFGNCRIISEPYDPPHKEAEQLQQRLDKVGISLRLDGNALKYEDRSSNIDRYMDNILLLKDELIANLLYEKHRMVNAEELFLIEAKPDLRNPMECMRQMKMYSSAIGMKTSMILWCPGIDDETRFVFNSQGIFVCSCTVEEINKLSKSVGS